MEQRISAWEARRQFGKVLNEVKRNRSSIIVESHGEEVAVVIPIEDYRRIRQERANFLDQIREVSARVNLSEDEAAPIIAEAMRSTGRLPE
jgi:prevent-host-death family protein